jgi:hypothetical protein
MGRALLVMLTSWATISSATALAAAPGVKVDILVIEAKREKGDFDPRIQKLKDKIGRAGYESAQVVDELSHREIEIGSRVSLQMPSKKQTLSVTVLEVTKDQKIKLLVAIEGMKFETTTEHTNGGLLLVGIPQKDAKTAMMLGVTPTLVP